MRLIKAIFLASVVSVVFTMGLLFFWPSISQASPKSAIAEVVQPNATVPVIAAASQQSEDFSPKSASDVIDVARLVLEVTRDQSSSLASFIERATTIIVVFFTLLGAGVAALGWNKMRDMEDAAKSALLKFETELDALQSNASRTQGEFNTSLEAATASVRNELNVQVELMGARAELDQAIHGNRDMALTNRMLTNAIKRIEAALATKEKISAKGTIRGIADLAYAKKRLGDLEGALAAIETAITLARSEATSMLPLLVYNAACYASLLGKQEALAKLAEAIELNSEYKDSAPKDPDFTALYEDPAFQVIVK